MRGKKMITVCMLLLFLLSILSIWVPVPRIVIQGVSLFLFGVSAGRNCWCYKQKTGAYDIGMCLLAISYITMTVVATMTKQLACRILAVVFLYTFFLYAEFRIYGKFRKDYLGLCVGMIVMLLGNTISDNVWLVYLGIAMQLVLILRLLNPLLEGMAKRGKQKRLALEMKQENVSWIRKILFGKSGRLRMPVIR